MGQGNLADRIKKIQDNMNKLNDEGTQAVPIEEILTDSFISEHSSSSSFSELLQSSGYSVAKFKEAPTSERDQLIKSKSDFASWEDMRKSAFKLYIKGKLLR